jgi:class 3 adenylate cyclase
VGVPSGTVTFCFTDIEGSTRLWESVPSTMGTAIERHDELLRSAVESHGGYVFSTGGDGFAVAFARAGDAIAAAVEAQSALAGEPWPTGAAIEVRMGLHTGEVQERNGDYFGSAVNRAARLMALAHGGQVVASAATADVVADTLPSEIRLVDLGEHLLRDLSRRERVFQVEAPGLGADFPPLRSPDVLPGNLPAQPTSFVGRSDEVRDLIDSLGRAHLVTVTGVGGVGKTRLAVQVAAELVLTFADGAWLCELAVAGDADTLAQVVASTLGVVQRAGRSLERSIVEFLRPNHLLLVLDNCEHLLDASGRLAAGILADCPQVRVLATSREALAVAGEQLWPLSSLDLPEPMGGLEATAGYASVRLFCERAASARPGFALSEANVAAVTEVCRRLDGIPLAIELAAARVSAMTPAEIAGLLDERFRLLTGGRRTAVERHQREIEEPAGRRDVTTLGQHDVDDLAELVHRPVEIPPHASDLHVGLVHEPAVAASMSARAGSVDQLRREPLHPAIQGDMVDIDAPLGQQLLQIPVRQAVAQVPAHRQHNHLGREPEPCEPEGRTSTGRRRRRRQRFIAPACRWSPSTQQSP